jgi:hypothetical protein
MDTIVVGATHLGDLPFKVAGVVEHIHGDVETFEALVGAGKSRQEDEAR